MIDPAEIVALLRMIRPRATDNSWRSERRPAIKRAGEADCGEVSLIAHSPLTRQISLGGTARWKRYRAPPWPPLNLSASNLCRFGRMFATSDPSPQAAPCLTEADQSASIIF